MIYRHVRETMKKTEKKKVNRYFNGVPNTRLIVSVEQSIVDEIDNLIKYDRNHPASKNRSEFVRLAIIEQLAGR